MTTKNTKPAAKKPSPVPYPKGPGVFPEDAAPQSSPLPWMVEDSRMGPKGDWDASITARSGLTFIGTVTGDDRHGSADQYDAACTVQEAMANAALIVRRVNQGPAFDAMVEALREMETVFGGRLGFSIGGPAGQEAIIKARAAIALAQEGK